MLLFVALLSALLSQPGALAAAAWQDLVFPSIREGPALAAVLAAHDDLREVAGGPLLEHQITACTFLVLHVHEPLPREVVEVPVLARDDEAHRHTVAQLGPGALVLVALPRLLDEVAPGFQGAAALAHEPGRKLRDLDAAALRGRRVVAGRREQERSVLRELEPLGADAGRHELPQARLIEGG